MRGKRVMASQKLSASELAFLEGCERFFDEMKGIAQDFVLRQHNILPVPAFFRYGRRSINQKLWEMSPELLKLINDDTLTSAEGEIHTQILAKELCKWLAFRSVYSTPEEPPVAPLDISDAVAAAVAGASSIEQLLIAGRQDNNQENGSTTALAKSKR